MVQTSFGVSDTGLGGLGGATRSGGGNGAGDGGGLFADTLNDQRNQLTNASQSAPPAQEPPAERSEPVNSQAANDEASAQGAEEKTAQKQSAEADSTERSDTSGQADASEKTAKSEQAKKSADAEAKADAKTDAKADAKAKADSERHSAEVELTRQIAVGKEGAKGSSSAKEAAALLHGHGEEKGKVDKAKGESKDDKDGKELPVALPLSLDTAAPKHAGSTGQDGGKAGAGKAHLAQSALGAIHAQQGGDAKASSQKLIDQVKDSLAQSGGDSPAGKAAGKGDAKGAADFLRTLQAVNPKEGAQTGPQPTVTGMSPTQAQGGGAAAPTQTASLTLPTPMGQPDWDKGLGDRLVWMVKGGVQEAKLQLTPRHLGPIDIKVSLNHDQASVSFTAHNPHTREALESAMPRLRDMLNDQGLNLAQSDVSQHQAGQQQHAHDGGLGGGHGGPGGDMLGGGLGEEVPEGAVIGEATVGVGALDYYA